MKKIAIIILSLAFNSLIYSNNNTSKADSTNAVSKKPVRTYYTTRLTTVQPIIDGTLDDECWKTGEWASDFTQWVPKEGAKPTYPTHLKVLYDDNNIYVAIRAFDGEPEKISRKAGRRDEFAGDCVGICLDSYHDHRTGFEFDITPAGQKIDLMLTNPSNGDFNWNAVWYAKTGFEDSAWTAEFRIPLSQLRYSSDKEQVWGMHCWRWIDRLQEESDWEVQSSTGPGILYLFGELHGIKDLPASRRIELMPYTLGKVNTFQKEANNPFADKGRTWLGNLGLDAKIGLSSNFTADLTINPDFGQVESDPSVMNLSAFETFYEEKRPFFLEGKNIFSFDFDNSSIFYSRRIGHAPSYSDDLRNNLKDNEFMDSPDNTTILSAVKLSGKTSDGLALGVLQSLTSTEKAKINFNGSERRTDVEPLTNFAIVRVQKDFDQANTVLGGIVTSVNRFIKNPELDFLNRNAYTAGLDFLHQWNDKEFFIDTKLVGSEITGNAKAVQELQNSSARYYQRPDVSYVDFDSSRTELSGYGGSVKIGKGSKGLWRYSAQVNWRSPGLDLNDLGYMQTSDIVKQEASVSYFVNQPVSIFRTYSIGFTQENNWDFGMNYLSSGGDLDLRFEFHNNWAISTSFDYTSKALDTRILRGGPAMYLPAVWSNNVYFRTDPSAKLAFELVTDFSKSVNNNLSAFRINPGFSFLPLNILKLYMEVDYSSNIDNLQYIDTKSVNNTNRYILGKINQRTIGVTFRIDYNITPEFSIQYYGSPFASVGKYSDFKVITDPKADDYNNRFSLINPTLVGDNYEVSENVNNGSGNFNYSFDNPDFNFSQFRSNLVLRWEYRPGSQVFLVWANERTYDVKPGRKSVKDTMTLLKDVYPNNIFLIKFNYWFSI